MKFFLCIFFLSIFTIAVGANDPNYIIIKIKKNVNIETVIEKKYYVIDKKLGGNMYLIKEKDGVDTQKILELLKKDQNVIFVQPDRVKHINRR